MPTNARSRLDNFIPSVKFRLTLPPLLCTGNGTAMDLPKIADGDPCQMSSPARTPAA